MKSHTGVDGELTTQMHSPFVVGMGCSAAFVCPSALGGLVSYIKVHHRTKLSPTGGREK